MTAATNAALSLAENSSSLLTSFRWLQYLRWVPLEIYSGKQLTHKGSYLEGQYVTETISALHCAPPVNLLPDSFVLTPLMTPPELMAVSRLLVLGKVVRHYRVMWRSAAKNVPIRLQAGLFAQPVRDSDEWSAVERFDQRRSATEGLNVASGTVGYALRTNELRSPTQLVLMSDRPRAARASDPRQFHMSMASIRLPDLLRQHNWYQPELPKLIFASQALAYLMGIGTPSERATVEENGYAILSYEQLKAILEKEASEPGWSSLDKTFIGFDRTTDLEQDALLAMLRSPGSVMPFRAGPILRPINSHLVCVDYAMMARRLALSLTPMPQQTRPSIDTRSRDFEQQTQRLIDETSWRPSAGTRSLVGSRPRLTTGETLTDLDAIAAKDDTCIIIDCKSFLPGDLNEGEFRLIRNVASQLERSQTKWVDQIARLSTDVKGHGELRRYSRLVPVIVTPGVYFTPLPVQEKMAMEGLPAIVSLEELLRFLNSH